MSNPQEGQQKKPQTPSGMPDNKGSGFQKKDADLGKKVGRESEDKSASPDKDAE